MLVDTEFPVKRISYYIPFAVHVYILETHSSSYWVTTVKATYWNVKLFLEQWYFTSRRGPVQISFHLNGLLNVAFLGYLTSPPPFQPTPTPPAYVQTHTSVFPCGCWVISTCMCVCTRAIQLARAWFMEILYISVIALFSFPVAFGHLIDLLFHCLNLRLPVLDIAFPSSCSPYFLLRTHSEFNPHFPWYIIYP